jgi:hypothetical protein
MRIACCAMLLLILCCLGSGNSQVRSQRFPVSSGRLYEFTVWAAPDRMAQRHVHVKISDGRGLLAEKPLHAFDPDFHQVLRARVYGDLTVDLTGEGVDQKMQEFAWRSLP